MNYQISHPWLSGDPRLEAMIKLNSKFLDWQLFARPEDDEEVARQQNELDRLVQKGMSALEKTPLRRWALYTGSPDILNFMTHIFFHQRVYHLILNILLLLPCAPFIEDLWGRKFFPAFFLTGGVVSAFGPILFGTEPVFLYGATGAVCAVIGAFAVRFRRVRIKLFSFSWLFSSKEFYTKPLPFLSFWFGVELVYAFVTRDHFGSLSVTVWSHCTGFLFGACSAWAIDHFKLELKLYASDYDKLPEEVRILSEVELQMNHREMEAAFGMLGDACTRFPSNMEILEKYWALAVRLGREKQIILSGEKLIDYLLSENEAGEAFFHWGELRKALGPTPVNLNRVTLLANQLTAMNERERASMVLKEVVQNLPKKASTEEIFALVDAAEFTEPKACLELIDKVLGIYELEDEARKGLKRQTKEIHLRFPNVNEADQVKAIEISPALADPTKIMEEEDPFAPTYIQVLNIHRGIPLGVTDKGLAFRLGDRERVLPLDQVRALSVGAIRNISGKPFLLIDLLTDNPMLEKKRHALLRLHSHEFSPMVLASGVEKPAHAIRHFVDRVLRESEAHALPDEETINGEKFPNYPSIHDYEMRVYGVCN